MNSLMCLIRCFEKVISDVFNEPKNGFNKIESGFLFYDCYIYTMKIPRGEIQHFNALFNRMYSSRMKYAREYYYGENLSRFNHSIIYQHGVRCLKNDVQKILRDKDVPTKQAKKIVRAWMSYAEALDSVNQLRGTIFCPRTQTVNIERSREIKARKAEQDEAEVYLRKTVYGEKWQQVKW